MFWHANHHYVNITVCYNVKSTHSAASHWLMYLAECNDVDMDVHVRHASFSPVTIIVTHRVSKNVPPLACYNFDTHEWILIFFGRNVTNKVGNQRYLTMPPQVTCASELPGKMGKRKKNTFSLSWIVLHTQCTCVLSSWKKKLSSVMCLIASNIC